MASLGPGAVCQRRSKIWRSAPSQFHSALIMAPAGPIHQARPRAHSLHSLSLYGISRSWPRLSACQAFASTHFISFHLTSPLLKSIGNCLAVLSKQTIRRKAERRGTRQDDYWSDCLR